MKLLFPIALLLLSATSFCQAPKDSVLTISAVVNVDSASKEQLFTRARQWFNASFRDARNVIRVADKETGEILAKGIIRSSHWYRSLGSEANIEVYYDADISIYVKDGKYKYEFKNFSNRDIAGGVYKGPILVTSEYPIKGYRKKEVMDKIWISQQSELNITVGSLVAGLKEMMAKSTTDF